MAGERHHGLDAARGLLLVAMVVVHVVSAHGSAPQVNALHGWVGVFLISAGFVGLSGYVIGRRPGAGGLLGAGRAVDSALHLLLVMAGYAVLVSLARHGLARLAGGPAACAARSGWLPPVRFDDLGILLPIALVQLQAPVARWRGLAGPLTAGWMAIAWMLLPVLTYTLPGEGLVGVLTRRTLTPFYTVSTFVAIGLACAALARTPLTERLERPAGRGRSAAAFLCAVVLAVPPWSHAILDQAYRLGQAVGSLAQLGYWLVVVMLFLRGMAPPEGASPGAARRALALLGRHSLPVFVLHAFLIEADTFARAAADLEKGAAVVLPMIAIDVALLLLAARWLETSAAARTVSTALLLERSRGASPLRSGAFTLSGALALAGVMAAYTGGALARPDVELMIDDHEAADGCPAWWSFGEISFQRAAGESGHVLEVRGSAPGMYAHGRGLYMDRDRGDRHTLKLDVRGHGPGSGKIKIELLDDDNGNWEIEKEPRLFVPLHDDRFVLELGVDWTGWRTLELPAQSFHDDNPGRGNDVFDPVRDLTSGGLLEMQLLFSPASGASDRVQIDLDNVRWAP